METIAKGEAFWNEVRLYRYQYLTANCRGRKIRENYQSEWSELGEQSS